jgi:hypothetical protein
MTNPRFIEPNSSDYQPIVPAAVLAGIKFTGYVTDDQNFIAPFHFANNNDVRAVKTSANNVATDSLFGAYKNDKVPSSSCSWDTCAKYLFGLEYIMGSYVRGGTQICVIPAQSNQCPNDITKCVSAKKIPQRDDNNKVVIDSAGNIVYIGVSTKPDDRVTPPKGQDGYYDPNDVDGTNCLNNKIKIQPIYSQISQCLPDCATSPTTSCVRKFNLVDSTCSPAINVNSYLSSDIVSNASSGSAVSSRSFLDADGNTINLNTTIDTFGNLIYTKTSSKDGAQPTTLLQTSINLSTVDANVTILNLVTNTNKIDQTAITTTIAPETSSVLIGTPLSVPGGKNPPSLPSNKGTSSTTNGIISITNGTKVVQSDPNALRITFQDSTKATVAAEVSIDIDNGFVTLNHITTDATTEVSTTNIVIFDPASNKYTSSVDVKDSISGSESGTSVNPVNGIITKVDKTTLIQGNVTTVTTITTTTNPTTYATTQVKTEDITTTENGVATTITRVTDVDGNVTESPPRTSAIATYYCYQKTTSSNTLPPDEGVRSKVGTENDNSCVEVPPPPTCPAIVDANGNASWPEASPGSDWVQGTCAANYVAVDPQKMGRQCIFLSTGISQYDSIDSDYFAGCKSASCGMYNLESSSTKNGYSSSPGYISNGSCSSSGCSKGVKFGFNIGNGASGINSEDVVQNTFTKRFNIQSKSSISIKFTQLIYDDGVRVIVNGSQISNDDLKGSDGWVVWPNNETNKSHNYPDLNALNDSLASKLVEGDNIIKIVLKTWGGGGILAELQYNSTCP